MTNVDKLRQATLFAATLFALPLAHAAEPFPSRPIKVVVPVSAGGWGDITTRIIAQRLGQEIGQPVVVENRPGGGGLVGIRYTKAEAADGYTLMSTGGTLSIQHALSRETGIDAMKDFVSVGSMVRSPAVVITGTGTEYKTMADVFKNAKSGHGEISYASAGVGTTTHIAAEMMLKQAGARMLHIPYKGNGAALPDVIAGRVSFMVDAYGSSSSNLKGGKLRALAVTSQDRLKLLPNVPTVAEQGLPGFSYYYWLGLFAPAGTPRDVVEKISTALAKTMKDPEVTERLRADGTEPYFKSPAEFTSFVRKDVADTTALVEKLSIQKQ
ncbi:tripartite tricarboxylate transporter substrate binding protein [Cupriavidus sp. CV2]|uniref:Bug family tripartite tricarboxylate transporter substrate binding protein n=1 Tax=Cupriavidus ulmosensis TaxID=3065913 RepID=UPI00296B5178|nr:tripartite tricarboxylate transporter substrate binding protein [Cupriavidus sp. CV2]MDW3682793.1 tripartite tricarboxylate transporter substrate binding protein [Cupriavidus sp. CV2]